MTRISEVSAACANCSPTLIESSKNYFPKFSSANRDLLGLPKMAVPVLRFCMASLFVAYVLA